MTRKSSTARRTKLIIFDVGGVVIRFDEKYYTNYLSKNTGINPERIKKALFGLITLMEYGRMPIEEFKSKAAARLGINKEKLLWAKAFELLASPNLEVENLIRELKRDYKIALLSNTSISRFLEAKRKIDKRLYERFFVSAYLHMRKPDPRIYRYVLDKMHVIPEEAIFVDNLEKNVKGARKIGIKTILFKGAKDLRRELTHIGVL